MKNSTPVTIDPKDCLELNTVSHGLVTITRLKTIGHFALSSGQGSSHLSHTTPIDNLMVGSISEITLSLFKESRGQFSLSQKEIGKIRNHFRKG